MLTRVIDGSRRAEGLSVGCSGNARVGFRRLGLILGALLCTTQLPASNGEIVLVSSVLRGVNTVDITRDTDGTFWVLGADGNSTPSHTIYHVNFDLETVLGTIENPHPSGTVPNFTLNRGIAFRNLFNDLVVVSSVGAPPQDLQLRIVSRDGTEVSAEPITLTLPEGDANLFGLSYDPLERELWGLDTQNDRVVRFALDGTITHSFLLPGKTGPETVLHGKGIAYALEGAEGRVYVSLGDLFHLGPDRIIEMTPDGVLVGDELVGESTGIEVPLAALPTPDRRGFAVFRRGFSLRRVALLAGDENIYEIEQVISDPLPPSTLTCALTTTNRVVLTWKNHGEGGAYNGPIQILRNGVPFATVPGDVETFTDQTPNDGTSTYALRSSEDQGKTFGDMSGECEVTVGTGGLITWTPANASSLYDVAVRPDTEEIFVTDSIEHRILHLDQDLREIGVINLGDWDHPGGITFVPSVVLGFPPVTVTDLLAVAKSSGNQLRFIDLAGETKTTISLRLKDENGGDVANPRIGGLTFVPDRNEFVLVELTQIPSRIHVLAADGRQVRSCGPPFILGGLSFLGPITYDPLQSTALAMFEDGFVRELFVEGLCPLTGEFEFNLHGVGEIALDPSFAGGMQISDNTLLVCGRTPPAVFRVLTFPFSPTFVRGDFDQNEIVNLSDAQGVANYLFMEGPVPTCPDAADANDDGVLDVSDAVYLLFWLFVPESPAPPAPYPEPGDDPTFRDNIGCGENS